MNVNPYTPPAVAADSMPGRSSLYRSLPQPLFAIASLATWICLAIGWFYLGQVIDPFYDIDVPFFFRLYIVVGGAFGLLSWYCARAVSLRYLRFRSVAIILFASLAVVLFALQSQSAMISTPPTAAIVYTVGLCWLACRRISAVDAGGIETGGEQ
ncbi:hypothetical protein [Allorhodopirellula heiligendammensis]|uniref:Uncharacterized protein n=1 Tax=Allorhodopirellula heiligendammensis TaxID=2714739 RepID=A0A5C6C8Z6_9BACT|nr:hypothetical protein [Allorhodopirellula heiligendammensis]TWU19239.1 hypothetical protein Poly21_14110 [Allorhodopirellula heiligendammensis]